MNIKRPPPFDKPWDELTDDELFQGIEEVREEVDMTGEPLWRRLWYKLMGIT